MIRRPFAFICGAVVALSAAATLARAQAIPNHSPLGSTLRPIEKEDWHIFGQVKTLDGEPASGAQVRVDIGFGLDSVKTVETDLQGNFQTDYNLDSQMYPTLSVTVEASKPGYLEARETVDFGAGGKTWAIDLTLRGDSEDPEQLSQAELISALAPRLMKAASASIPGSARKDFKRGTDEFLVRHDAVRAVPYLRRVSKRAPDSVECHELLGLALLDQGSWEAATQEFAQAATLNSAAKSGIRPEPFLLLAVLESWKGEQEKAAGFLLQALKVAPSDALVAEELGRVELLDHNWQGADEYLDHAITRLGAPPEARLLRVRAVLEEGDADEAENEMKQYLHGRNPRTMPPAVRMLYANLQNRIDLESYNKVQSVVSQPVAELVKAMPELKTLVPASADTLPGILKSVGSNVAALFTDFPNTISVEQIRQERLRSNGKVQEQLDQKYEYLLVARPEDQGLGLEEYRGDSTGARAVVKGLQGGFMLTSGFASAALIFHPAYQSGSSFRYLGHESMDGHDTDVVAFAQKPSTARMVERFNADDDSVLILVQGVAWIDAATHEIVRMRTDLLKPQPKVRLERQTTEIQFGEVRFKEISKPFWLPRDVTVTVEWKGHNYRNLHEYSGFRLFNVNTNEKRNSA